MKPSIRLTDVAPRDGLQNEPHAIPTAEKLRLVESIALTGVDEIEVSSFVSPRWVPQLADAAALFDLLATRADKKWPLLSALVPNEQGLDAAMDVNARAGRLLIGKISVFTAASETFSRKNTNATISETLQRFRPVIARARDAGLAVRGYVSCVVRCPFEGPVSATTVSQVAQALFDLGASEVDLGDTIGAAEPGDLTILLNAVVSMLGDSVFDRLTLHLHDTFGRAASCLAEALELGIRSLDASSGGLGGCPYASTPGARAPGNIAMDTVLSVLQEGGYPCGADPLRVAAAGEVARSMVRSATPGGESQGDMR